MCVCVCVCVCVSLQLSRCLFVLTNARPMDMFTFRVSMAIMSRLLLVAYSGSYGFLLHVPVSCHYYKTGKFNVFVILA